MKLPDFSYELELWNKGYTVIGIDEVGRGAFAGPLCVAGTIFSPCINDEKRLKFLLSLGINDSKKLKPQKRELLAKVIQKECFSYHISTVNVAEINHYGIGKATFIAMRDVVKNLREKINTSKNYVLVDGFYIKHLKGIGLKNQKAIVRGDQISLSIAAASIIAKVYRDKQMRNYSKLHPHYGWGRNKGYGSLEHRLALKKYGSTLLHRKDFVENFI